MKNQFFIKKGSFCFIVPFFTENSSVCNTYFKDLKNEIKQLEQKVPDEDLKRAERKKIIKELKEKFISQIRTDYFPDIKPNLKTRFCEEIKSGGGNYNGRFLCKCMSSAVKFHDDISQQRNAAQFFLDSFKVIYNYGEFECSFNFNTILYLMHEDKEKAAYLSVEINMEDINDFKIVDKISVPHSVRSEQIIFIKHLFYKSKMRMQIQRLTNNKETLNNYSLQQWVKDYLNNLCIALKLDKDRDVPEYISNHAFEYSFIELKDICDINGEELDIDFNNIDKNFLDKYSRQAYGLLLSDEGWDKTPLQIIKSKLQDYWTTRNFVCTFFLQHNALLFNLKNTKRGEEYKDFGCEWFSNYQENKYMEYVSDHPCLTGVDSLSIFPFLKAIYKEINIDYFEHNYNKADKYDDNAFDDSFIWQSVSKRINTARKELESLQDILSQTSLNLGEIAGMEKCIYKQFGIIEKTARIKDLYKQQVDKLNFIYESANNKNILNLTLLTFILGLFSLLISFLEIYLKV